MEGMAAGLSNRKNPLYFLLTVFKCMNPPSRQNATMECGGKIDDEGSMQDIATHKGAINALGGFPESNVDYLNDEKTTLGLAINRSYECTLTACKRHCKEYSWGEAVEMVTFTLCLIWMICGVMGCPFLIVNVSFSD